MSQVALTGEELRGVTGGKLEDIFQEALGVISDKEIISFLRSKITHLVCDAITSVS